MGEHAVERLGQAVLPLLVHENFAYDLVDEVVLLVDDLRLVALVQHVGQVDGVLFADLLVPLEQLEGVPTLVDEARVFFVEGGDDGVDLVLHLVRVHHRVFLVVVVAVVRYARVLVHQRVGRGVPLVVHGGVQQDVQPPPLARGDGHHRDAQHLG